VKQLRIISLLFISNICLGQAPGYMGKKFMFGVSGCYSPTYSNLLIFDRTTVNYDGEEINRFLAPLRLGGGMKYVISENRTLQFDIYYQQIGVSTSSKNSSSYNNDPDGVTKGNPFKYSRASFVTYSFGLTQSVATAPVGRYFGSNVVLILADVESIDTDNNVYKTGNAMDFGLNSEYGIRRVFKDKIVLETGLNISIYFRGVAGFVTKESNDAAADRMISKALFANFINNFCTLKLGVYYLL
jgi:hypothetical protein